MNRAEMVLLKLLSNSQLEGKRIKIQYQDDRKINFNNYPTMKLLKFIKQTVNF